MVPGPEPRRPEALCKLKVAQRPGHARSARATRHADIPVSPRPSSHRRSRRGASPRLRASRLSSCVPATPEVRCGRTRDPARRPWTALRRRDMAPSRKTGRRARHRAGKRRASVDSCMAPDAPVDPSSTLSAARGRRRPSRPRECLSRRTCPEAHRPAQRVGKRTHRCRRRALHSLGVRQRTRVSSNPPRRHVGRHVRDIRRCAFREDAARARSELQRACAPGGTAASAECNLSAPSSSMRLPTKAAPLRRRHGRGTRRGCIHVASRCARPCSHRRTGATVRQKPALGALAHSVVGGP